MTPFTDRPGLHLLSENYTLEILGQPPEDVMPWPPPVGFKKRSTFVRDCKCAKAFEIGSCTMKRKKRPPFAKGVGFRVNDL